MLVKCISEVARPYEFMLSFFLQAICNTQKLLNRTAKHGN